MSLDTQNLHSDLFRLSLANVEIAKDFFKAHLKPFVVERIDWTSLQHTNKSYVEEELKPAHADVVYRCQIEGNEAYIHVLLEQQEKPDRMLPFRVFSYTLALLQEHADQGCEELPLVLNLVVYAGKNTPYPYSVDLYDCFKQPNLARSFMFTSHKV